jgi:dTDP-4-dehydrorhamnose 3,5-epimerase
MLWIPEGFAHGFQSLEDDTVVEYKVTREYHRASEGGILWNDPSIGIKWPLKDARLSAKDALLPTLDNAENNF